MEHDDLRVSLDRTLPGRAVFVSRVLWYTVLAIVVFAIAWSALTRVDMVVSARGRLAVEGEPLRISVPEPGITADVPVHVGQHVEAGQTLLRLESFRYDTDEARLAADLDGASADLARYRAAAESCRTNRKYRVEECELARRSVDMLNVQLEMVTSTIDNPSVPGKQVELETAKIAMLRADNALAANASDTVQADQQAAACEARVRSLTGQLAALREARQRLTVTAPRGGTIASLAALHPGIAVATAEPAVVLIPDGQPLMAMAKIPNASMHRLHAGEAARIALDAYPRADFGDLPGQLQQIDPDADEQGFYRAWIKLDRSSIRGPAGSEALRPGLELDARIIIERRSVLMLVLDPLRRLGERASVAE